MLKKRSSKAEYHKYLELDPNNDNVITLEELTALSKKVFAIIDLDQDGVISREEYNGYRKTRNKKDISTMRFWDHHKKYNLLS